MLCIHGFPPLLHEPQQGFLSPLAVRSHRFFPSRSYILDDGARGTIPPIHLRSGRIANACDRSTVCSPTVIERVIGLAFLASASHSNTYTRRERRHVQSQTRIFQPTSADTRSCFHYQTLRQLSVENVAVYARYGIYQYPPLSNYHRDAGLVRSTSRRQTCHSSRHTRMFKFAIIRTTTYSMSSTSIS